jgi:hypothetical protein
VKAFGPPSRPPLTLAVERSGSSDAPVPPPPETFGSSEPVVGVAVASKGGRTLPWTGVRVFGSCDGPLYVGDLPPGPDVSSRPVAWPFGASPPARAQTTGSAGSMRAEGAGYTLEAG